MPRKTWNIEVTQDDIDWAMRNDSAKCVVARAIGRTIPDAHHIGVDIQTVRFSRDEPDTSTRFRYEYLTPPSIEDYVVDFDAGDKIEPFQFRLQRPKIYSRDTTSKSEAKKHTTGLTKRRPSRRSRKGRHYGRRALRENQERTTV